jgi:hypothetical protein
VSRRVAHLAANEEKVLCGRWRTGGTETLVGPPRMELKAVICKRCWGKYQGPIGWNSDNKTFRTTSPLKA